MMDTERKFITVRELSELWGVKISWLRRQIFLRKIPHYKVEGLIRFEKASLEEWLKEMKIENFQDKE